MSNTDKDYVILVNENDEELGIEPKLPAHQKGLLHRAFSICVCRHDPAEGWLVLLQQRHPDKYHCGGLWTNSCCSHPRPDEKTEQAASRRLKEEMGLNLTLKKAGTFIYRAEFDNGLIEHELDHVFYTITDDTSCEPNALEVSAVTWAKLDELLALNDTSNYTPWMKPVLDLVSKQLPEY